MSNSPDYLETSKIPNTKKFNKRPILVGMAIAMIPAAIFIFGYYERYQAAYGEQTIIEEDTKKTRRSAVPAVVKPEGPDIVIPSAPPPEIFSEPPVAGLPRQQGANVSDHDRARVEALKTALVAKTTVSGFSRESAEHRMPGYGDPQAEPSREPDRDLNRQNDKREFLEANIAGSQYLPHKRVAARSDKVIQAGTMISGAMIGGVNSDLPGQIVGQVAENVYDSVTGNCLLIPAATKTVGSYDSRVSAGQERVLIGWNWLKYSDGSSLRLDTMPGADASGVGGMRGEVDNHYWRTFGNAFLLSLFSAGIQLSQPRPAVQGTFSSSSIMAAAIGRQLGQLGMQLTQRNLNIQPTLTIEPGAKFSIMVTKDMEFDECLN